MITQEKATYVPELNVDIIRTKDSKGVGKPKLE